MDYWIEDSEWRKFGSQQGRDDWDFYRDKYGFSQGKMVDWNSGSLKELPSYIHSNSYFRIKKSLNKSKWLYVMGILARIDVSQIEHMELRLPLELNDITMKSLTAVLGSGRFSRLQTLRMRFASAHKFEDESALTLLEQRSLQLAHALRRGCFKNLVTLSLPFGDVDVILKSLIAGEISRLRSLSIGRYPGCDVRESWSDAFSWGIVEDGCFKSLEHLDLGIMSTPRAYCLGFTRWMASGNMPNLKSLSLSRAWASDLTDLVPLLVRSSNPLENLIVNDCHISSSAVHEMVDRILKERVVGLALKHLDFHNHGLDEGAVEVLQFLANFSKLPRLEGLDLSGNVSSRTVRRLSENLGLRTVRRLRDCLLNGHLRGSRVDFAAAKGKRNKLDKINSDSKKGDKVETQAITRLYTPEFGFPDQWVYVRSLESDTGEERYSLEDIHFSDLDEKVQVELLAHLPAQIPPPTGLGDVLGADQIGTILKSLGISTLKTLTFNIATCWKVNHPKFRRGIFNLSAFSRLPPASLYAGYVSELILSLPPSHLSKILRAFSAGHTCLWRSFTINISKGFDNLSRSILAQNLDAVFKSGCFKGLQHLELSGGVLDGIDGWKVLIQAIGSGHLESIISMRLSQNAWNLVDLADLAPLLLSSSFESLVMPGCLITSNQVVGLANAIMNGAGTSLALKTLDFGHNLLGNTAVDALVNLANSDFLPQLEKLDLSMNKAMGSGDLISLIDTFQQGCLPRLDNINWGRNAVNDDAAHLIVAAYYEGHTVTFDIDWNQVEDLSLKAKAEEYRNSNRRLTALKVMHKEVLMEEVPLTRAKVFLGGYPEVGKTTLRRALTQCPLDTHPLKEARTRGIELSYLEGKNVTLTLWDLAGHEEYHVLHGTFFPDLGLAGGKATTFVLVFKASFERGVKDVERDLLYWLRFAASSSKKFVPRHVVIVLNCFEGKNCTEGEKRLWMALLQASQERFKDFLNIRLDPFVMDVRLAEVVEPLKNHLFEKTEILLQNVMVPKVCFELQERVKRWSQSEKNNRLPVMSWQVFEMHLNLKHMAEHSSGKDFKVAALYVHEIGGIIYFDNQKLSESGSSERRSVVVLDPDWLCSKVVGELLLPEEWLDGKGPLQVRKDGSIGTHLFEAYFKHLLVEGTQSDDVILMLERLGLCFRKNAKEIIIPALIQQDDYKEIDWEDEGSDLAMGRRLAVEDQERSAIPVTLFRRLQVELAKDLKFGGRGDSEYKAGKSFTSFKVGELLVLIQFNVDHLNPANDRIDVLVKNVIRDNPTNSSLAQAECICEIVEKLEKLCVACCPGLKYDIKAIKPWSATKKTPEMIEREIMSLREIKGLLMKDLQYSSWRINGIPVELTTLLSKTELEKVQEVQRNWRLAMVTDESSDSELNVSSKAGEETDALDYWSSSEVSEGSEDGEDFSQRRIEVHENSDVSLEALGEIGEPDLVSTPLTGATSSSKSFVPLLRQLDDMVFEVYNPPHPETPELEVVFFHGLELKSESDIHVLTWMTRDDSDLWLQTLLKPEFPGAHILIVSYDSSPKKTYTEGLLDMYRTAENLLHSLTSDGVKLGQSRCPVVLVGHCLGGMVIKELCLTAAKKLNLTEEGSSERERIKNLVDSLKGMFFYATAHSGSPMVDLLYIQAEGLLLDQMKIFNEDCSRRNGEFEQLRRCRKWLTRGVAESRETYLEFMGESLLVVPEASARHYMDCFITVSADHFDICKPAGSSSSSFQFLAGFLRQIRDAEVRRAGVVRNATMEEDSEGPWGLQRRLGSGWKKWIRGSSTDRATR